MTKERAIDILDTLIGMVDIRPSVCGEVDEALRMAIEALKEKE